MTESRPVAPAARPRRFKVPPPKRIKVVAWACACAACGHTWTSLGEELPPRCARCKRTGWRPDVPHRAHPRRPS